MGFLSGIIGGKKEKKAPPPKKKRPTIKAKRVGGTGKSIVGSIRKLRRGN
jgi:hypothetical protein